MHEGAREAAGARALPAAAAPDTAGQGRATIGDIKGAISDDCCVFSCVQHCVPVTPSGLFLQNSCHIRLTETNTFVSRTGMAYFDVITSEIQYFK